MKHIIERSKRYRAFLVVCKDTKHGLVYFSDFFFNRKQAREKANELVNLYTDIYELTYVKKVFIYTRTLPKYRKIREAERERN